MDDTDLMLKKLGRKTMFNITDEEMPALREQYEVFMSHVQALDEIDTEGVEPLAFPYVVETTFLREDVVSDVLTQEEALKNVKDARMGHVHVPKVVK